MSTQWTADKKIKYQGQIRKKALSGDDDEGLGEDIIVHLTQLIF